MSVYVYCLKQSLSYQSLIKGRTFENQWFSLESNGIITVEGTNHKGYAWDGCSPKIKFKDIYLGTFEGAL